MSLYRYPEIYATLLYPETDLLEDLMGWISLYLHRPMEGVMDPCCGPGTWLLPFAARGERVLGNDLSSAMVAEARQRLSDVTADGEGSFVLTEGDMTALTFQDQPVDVAVNLHASIGHLKDDESVEKHLRTVYSCMRPGGLYFLGLCIYDGEKVDETVWELYDSDPTVLPSGGVAAVRYESIRRDPVKRRETIRVLLLTKGVPNCPERLEEEYELMTFESEGLRQLVTRAGFEIVAVHAMEEDGHPELGWSDDCGDVTVVLRRPAE